MISVLYLFIIFLKIYFFIIQNKNTSSSSEVEKKVFFLSFVAVNENKLPCDQIFLYLIFKLRRIISVLLGLKRHIIYRFSFQTIRSYVARCVELEILWKNFFLTKRIPQTFNTNKPTKVLKSVWAF